MSYFEILSEMSTMNYVMSFYEYLQQRFSKSNILRYFTLRNCLWDSLERMEPASLPHIYKLIIKKYKYLTYF